MSFLSKLLSNGADDVVKGAIKRSKIGDALVNASNVGLNAPLSLTRKGMREVGDDASIKIGKLYDRTGMSNVEDLRTLASELTGGKNSFMDEVTNYMQTNGTRGNFVDLSDLAPQIRDLKDGLPKAIRNSVSEKDPVQMSNYFRSAAADIRKSATPKAGDKELANMYESIGREINKRVEGNIEPKYISRGYVDTIDEFRTRAKEATKAGNNPVATAYNKLADELSAMPEKDRTLQNYRSFKRDFVDLSKMLKLSDQSKGGGSISRAVKEVPVVGNLLDATIAIPAERASQKAGEIMRKTGKAFQSGKAQDALKKTAMVGGGLGLLSMLGANNQPLDTIQQNYDAQDPRTALATPQGELASQELPEMADEELTVGGYNRDQLEQAYVSALMNGDNDAAKTIGTLVSMLDDKEERASTKAKSKTDTTSSAKKQAGLSTLQTLLGSYERGGGGQGVLLGNLTNLLNTATGGAFNPSAQAYATQSRGAAAQIIKALGESGNLSDRDVEAAINMLPKNTDTKAVAQEKINNLMTLLSTVE